MCFGSIIESYCWFGIGVEIKTGQYFGQDKMKVVADIPTEGHFYLKKSYLRSNSCAPDPPSKLLTGLS